ncbi:MAG: tRNA pseudouridine(55) synthase TruB [Alphaproteobacteria bacterium]|nr:tRNA pseudouridine(55) synthase TruB [Alphaproteobacteria bacterium]
MRPSASPRCSRDPKWRATSSRRRTAARNHTVATERGPHGWLVIDKPPGMTSSQVVAAIRRRANAKVGHAGTLDPLATGVLPIAIGEATKTTSYAMSGRKHYRFRVRWGVARATDDREGEVTAECEARPSRAAIEAVLPRFIGTIPQSPPAYSAIKLNGRRAYALSRADRAPSLERRPVEILELRLIATPDPDHADCEARVGKGTYIRALARDLGAALGTFAHVTELRRLCVGRFTENQAIALDSITRRGHISADYEHLLPIETALDDIPALTLTEGETTRLRSGLSLRRGRPGEGADFDRLEEGTVVSAWHRRALVALARIDHGHLRPLRVMNY